jgi:uncharacterized repeat protein (TIGR01451 family)
VTGASIACTGTHEITQDDLDAGSVANTATTSALDPKDQPVSATGSTTVGGAQAPHLSLTKTVAETTYAQAGEALHYTLTATNDGNATLTNAGITDPLLPTLSCTPTQPATLIVGESLVCTGTYAVTQNDVDAGSVANTATANATDPGSGPVSATASATASGAQSPHLAVTKSVAEPVYSAVGDTLHYTITVTNDGNATLTSVSVADPLLPVLDCTPSAPATLAVNAAMACTGTYTVVQADLDAGSIANTATASGTGPGNQPVSGTATATVNATVQGHLSVTKTVTETSFAAAGDALHYTITATNDGNATLHGVAITDPLIATLQCTPAQPATLAPTETLTCTGTYAATQADVDAGSLDNTATAAGKDPADHDVTATGSATVAAARAPHLGLAKTAAETNYTAPGDAIHYTLTATNDGNVTLTAVSIADPLLATLQCTPSGPTTLAPGATLTCTGAYTVTAKNVTDRAIDNTATATGTDPTRTPVTATATKSIPAADAPHLSLTKTPSAATYDHPGEAVTYTLTATNDGNTALTGVTIADPKLAALSCTPQQPADLAIGATLTCTGAHTVTSADMTSGAIVNDATASGSDPAGGTVAAAASATVSAAQAPHLTITKSVAEPTFSGAGDTLHYTITARNDGNVTLTDVAVSDPRLPHLVCSPAAPATLGVGDTMTCTGTYTVTAADVAAGRVDNTATVTGRAGNVVVAPPPASASAIADPDPHLTIRKTVAEHDYSSVGEVLHYTITVTNDGTVPAHDVTVSDPLVPALACTPKQPATLGVGETMTCTGTHTVTQADLDRGSVTNIATVVGKDPSDGALSGTDGVTVHDPAKPDPQIHVEKTSDAHRLPAGGGFVTYTYVVTNPGNVPLTNVRVSDNKCAPAVFVGGDDGDAILQPGEAWTFTCTQRLTSTTTNIATVSAEAGAVVAQDTDAVTVAVAAANNATTPQITLPPTDVRGGADDGRGAGNGSALLLAPALLGLAAGLFVVTRRRRRA